MSDDKAKEPMDAALEDEGEERYLLRLYVAGTTPKSARAIANIKRICEERLQGRYDLEIIDVYQQPDAADGDKLIAVPMLIKCLPAPLRRIIGDLSDKERVILGLGMKPKDD